MTEPKDYPFYAVAEAAQRLIEAGYEIHQKFTCAHCGARQTMDEANKFFLRGVCQECGEETNIVARGCNYVAMFGVH